MQPSRSYPQESAFIYINTAFIFFLIRSFIVFAEFLLTTGAVWKLTYSLAFSRIAGLFKRGDFASLRSHLGK